MGQSSTWLHAQCSYGCDRDMCGKTTVEHMSHGPIVDLDVSYWTIAVDVFGGSCHGERGADASSQPRS